MKKMISFVVLLFGLFSTSFVLADLNDGLVAYYPFNGNTDDESGNGYHGKIEGNITYEVGPVNQAAKFDGNSYILIKDLFFPIGEGTINMWVKVNGDAQGEGFAIDSKTNFRSAFSYKAPSDILGIPPNTFRIGYPTVELVKEKWMFYTFVYENGTSPSGIRKAFVNGNLEVTETGYTNNAEIPWYGVIDGNSSIGIDVEHGSDIYKGMIDDIRIYNRALSVSEIEELYSEGNLTNLTLFPPSGKLATTSGFDLTLIVQTPTLSVVGITAILDGSDVSNPVLACVREGTLPSGGETFRCPGLKAGTHLGVGTHTLNVTVDLNDGSSVSDEVTWEVIKNIE